MGSPKTNTGGVEIINADGNDQQNGGDAEPHQAVDHLLMLIYGMLQQSVFVRQRLYSIFDASRYIFNRDFNFWGINLAKTGKLYGGNSRLAKRFLFASFKENFFNSLVGWEISTKLNTLGDGFSGFHAPRFQIQNALPAISGLHSGIISFLG
jgi:hypothetical protein